MTTDKLQEMLAEFACDLAKQMKKDYSEQMNQEDAGMVYLSSIEPELRRLLLRRF